MIEIRLHGRGGQGGVTLAKIIAMARFLEGHSVQAFGLYAAERSGAPIQAFCRYDTEPITNRNLIYRPDHVIVLDPTLVGPAVCAGLAAGGWILINAPEPPDQFQARFPAYRLATVDATAIARANGLGTRSVPIVNTALAGAAARMLGIPLTRLHAALDQLGFSDANQRAANQAHEQLQVLDAPPDTAVPPYAPPPLSAPPTPGFIEVAPGEWPRIQTGQWATDQPRRQQMVPPCNHVCPAGNDVQGFLHALARDDPDEALSILLRTSPFPSTCGRVCPAPCMENCNRIGLDGAVNVRQLERYAGDHGTATVAGTAPRAERVAIVGSGPAGLSAAYQLARFGYRPVIYEGGSELGGLLRSGIPAFRLPPEVLDREIGRILDLGVAVETGARIDRKWLLELAQSHEAVLVATGLQELRGLNLGAGGSDAVIQGIDFLERSHRGAIGVDDLEVLVVGGGNTAMDAARSALRLGARSVRVVYRRTRAEMPAIGEEIDEAIEEGVTIDFLVQPIGLRREGTDRAGRGLYTVTCRRMVLGEPDASGRRAPVEVPHSDFGLTCHLAIVALGQSADVSVFPEGTEVREGDRLLGLLETPVFAIGDLATNDGTVAGAIGSGRRAALHIHEALSGEVLAAGREAARPVDVWRDEVIDARAMKLHLFERMAPAGTATIPMTDRRSSFDEIHAGLPDAREAKRCLSCGVCNECDLCVTYCPEGVLKRVGHEFVFDYSFCKGCGICASECPRNVIFMSHL